MHDTPLTGIRPTERGGRWGYFSGARTNRGPGALVNANVDACTASYYRYNPFCATKMHKITPFSSIFKNFFWGSTPRPPLCHKTMAFMQHNMYSGSGYTRGPKLKLPQGPIILSTALHGIVSFIIHGYLL